MSQLHSTLHIEHYTVFQGGWAADGSTDALFTGRLFLFEQAFTWRKAQVRLMSPHQDLSQKSLLRRAHRVIASLNRDQVDYLDKIGKDAQFSSGVKLSRTQVLAAMVNVMKRLSLTGEGVTTAKQFEERIVDAIHGASHHVSQQDRETRRRISQQGTASPSSGL